MRALFVVVLVGVLQACAPTYPYSYQQPLDDENHALLQSSGKGPGLFGVGETDLQIRSINGRLISPREEETWKLKPYTRFNIWSGDTHVEVYKVGEGSYGYVAFSAQAGGVYTISYRDEPDEQHFSLLVTDGNADVIAEHSFRKRRWGEYAQPEKELALFDAIAMGEVDEVKRLLEEGADPNWIDANISMDPLYITAREENLAILNLLIAAGAVIDGYEGARALTVSAGLGNVEMVELLLAHGADPNLRQRGANSALMVAAAQGQARVVSLLLKEGVYKGLRNTEGQTALDLARRAGHEDVVALLAQ